MRISDWSSDVCSSDLAVLDQQPAGVHARSVPAVPAGRLRAGGAFQRGDGAADVLALLGFAPPPVLDPAPAVAADVPAGIADCGSRLDRKSVVSGHSVSVRV